MREDGGRKCDESVDWPSGHWQGLQHWWAQHSAFSPDITPTQNKGLPVYLRPLVIPNTVVVIPKGS